MPKYTEKIEKLNLPVVPVRGLVVFPSIPISFEINSKAHAALCEEAEKFGEQIFFVSQKDMAKEKVTAADLYTVGTVGKIKQLVHIPEGGVRIVVDGKARATVVEYDDNANPMHAELLVKSIEVHDNGGVRGEALVQGTHDALDNFIEYLPRFSPELSLTVKSLKSPGILADFVACNVLIRYEDKQKVLEEFEPLRRLELLSFIMESELLIMRTESEIHRRVREQIDQNQREYYLREQIKVIQNELGQGADLPLGDSGDEEIDEYFTRIMDAHLPEEVEEKLTKELKKLAKMPYASAESSVLRNYLDVCLEIPWCKLSRDRNDIEVAEKILERDHDGLEKVKERILEFIAVKQLNPELRHQIICLVGPPGTGKTSIGRSIATAMKRKYVRVSLGGIRDEADIRGHRKTYVGAMPGRIINAIVQAGVRNPLVLLDEIDKMTRDSHGDPSSAMLEVLDSEQNKTFRDHFVELPLDLSDCVFIATANSLDTIPRPLIDRMEIIELHSYSRNEKLSIAKHHLIPKQLKRHGLSGRILKIADSAVLEMIDHYTAEAGVRNLEREIGSLCRKGAKHLIESGAKTLSITASNISKYLGPRKIMPEAIADENEIGVVNGLAYTEVGGDLLKVEVAVMPGNGKLELTGSLGDVMKESAHAAITYIRSHHTELGIDADFYKTKDIHIHVPEGAVPKDGPSAGVTITTAMVSELSGTPVRRDVAMTGEITLRGRVLAIGGLKEKTMAAYRAGVKTVLIPAENERDLVNIDKTVRESLTFIPCKTASDVLMHALVRNEELPIADASAKTAECVKAKADIIANVPPKKTPARNRVSG
ncbi:MAG: endopeptidase La [Clostridia bacterium]|nr:endopeptidase La [Clostridia bacterium]